MKYIRFCIWAMMAERKSRAMLFAHRPTFYYVLTKKNLVFNRFKIFFSYATEGAYEIIWKIFKGCARSYASIWVA